MKKCIASLFAIFLTSTAWGMLTPPSANTDQIKEIKHKIYYFQTFLDAMPEKSMDPARQTASEKKIVDQTATYIVDYVEDLKALSPDDAVEFNDLMERIRVYRGEPKEKRAQVRKVRAAPKARARRPKPRKVVTVKIKWLARYKAIKKDKDLIRKIVLLKAMVQKAPDNVWEKNVGGWPIVRPFYQSFKKYVIWLSGKVKKQKQEIKKAYLELLTAASKHKYLKRYAEDFKERKARI